MRWIEARVSSLMAWLPERARDTVDAETFRLAAMSCKRTPFFGFRLDMELLETRPPDGGVASSAAARRRLWKLRVQWICCNPPQFEKRWQQFEGLPVADADQRQSSYH